VDGFGKTIVIEYCFGFKEHMRLDLILEGIGM
jgi:hypothetical protein